MQTIRNLAILAGMAGIAMLIAPAPARANLTISYSIVDSAVGGPPTTGSGTGTVANFTSLATSGTQGDMSYTFSSTATQSAILGTATSNSISVSNLTSGTDTMTILVAITGYTLPNPSGSLTSSASGVTPYGTPIDTATLQSFANASNAGIGSIFTVPPSVTSGAQVGHIVGGIPTENYNFDGTASASAVFASAGTYSIGEMFVITLGAGAQANLTLATNVLAGVATPEPGTIAMALTALPVLALVARARRRRTVA